MYLSETTIVTAYYKLTKSKHTQTEYRKWIQNLCKLPCAIVIFTSEDCAFDFYQWRKPFLDRTRVFVRPFDSFGMTCSAMMRIWEQQYLLDPEKHIHSPQLYAMWALKQELVRIVVNQNPFQSRWFTWFDAGMIRYEFQLAYYSSFPSEVPHLCQAHRMTFLEVTKIPDSYVIDWVEKKPMAWPVPRETLGGGCIVGDATAWTDFGSAYKEALKEFMYRGWFAGKDQIVFFMMLMEHRTQKPFRLFFATPLLRVEDYRKSHKTEWFSLPAILGGTVDAILDTRFEDDDEQRNQLPKPLGL